MHEVWEKFGKDLPNLMPKKKKKKKMSHLFGVFRMNNCSQDVIPEGLDWQ